MAFRFHLGSIAFGSLIIAAIQFIRAVVTYIEEKTNTPNKNYLQRCLFCCIQCCLKCVECCMDKISKNAYIWMAIWGDSFGDSVCSSFALIWSNLARVAAVNLVSSYLMAIGKFLVAVLTAGTGALLILIEYEDEINTLAFPVVIIFLFAWVVAALFMVIVETTTDTVFFCFLVDEKFNKGTGAMKASPALIAIVDKYGEESAKQAEIKKSKYQQASVSGESNE